MEDVTEVREHYADRPGVGHHVEELLAQRANAVAYEQDPEVIDAIDQRLAAHGWDPKARAAKARKDAAAAKAEDAAAAAAASDAEAAKANAEAEARRTPPADRKTAPREKG